MTSQPGRTARDRRPTTACYAFRGRTGRRSRAVADRILGPPHYIVPQRRRQALTTSVSGSELKKRIGTRELQTREKGPRDARAFCDQPWSAAAICAGGRAPDGGSTSRSALSQMKSSLLYTASS